MHDAPGDTVQSAYATHTRKNVLRNYDAIVVNSMVAIWPSQLGSNAWFLAELYEGDEVDDAVIYRIYI